MTFLAPEFVGKYSYLYIGMYVFIVKKKKDRKALYQYLLCLLMMSQIIGSFF